MSRDFLDALEDQLREATTRGEVSRRRRLRLRLARWISTPMAVGGVAVVASATAVAAGLTGQFNGPAAGHGTTTTATVAARTGLSGGPAGSRSAQPVPAVVAARDRAAVGSVPAGGPVPPGFQPASFTAINELDWWLLGPAPCASPPCTSIVRTRDGGRSFVGLPAPRTNAVTQLRFADALDGYAFDPQLWTTHDGGETWRRLQVGGPVSELAAGGGHVYALVSLGAAYGYRLVRSGVAADTWRTLRTIRDGQPVLWVQGREVMVVTQARSAVERLLISTDDGLRFQAGAVLPKGENFCGIDATLRATIWAQCLDAMTVQVLRASGARAKFIPSRRGAFLPMTAFAAASPSTAIAGSSLLERTTDGGRSWRPAVAPANVYWTYLGFTDATHGVAIGTIGPTRPGQPSRLYYTTDAGASYHYVPITP